MTARAWPAELLAGVRRWHDDPVAFVREVLEVEPDAWQLRALELAAKAPRVAMRACKGPGKTAVLAWLALWFLVTRPHANVICCSVTAANLRDNLWKEIYFWASRPRFAFFKKRFDWGGERIQALEASKTWWVSARSFPADARPDQQANTLAGLHSDHVLVILDEVSDYPLGVLGAAEGIFTVQDQEARLVVAGNPTRSEGPLWEICGRRRAQWELVEITGDPDDPARSPRIDLEHAREQIALFGRDDPWVMVNILGLFPPVSEDKLVSPDDVTRAQQRNVADGEVINEPVIYGLDVARYGADASILRRRQGPVLFKRRLWRGLDGPTLASRVAACMLDDERTYERKADALFVDVAGVGSSAYDHLRIVGMGAITYPVDFASAADDTRYINKRSEIWHRMAAWFRNRASIPSDSADLGAQVCGPSFRWREVNKRTGFLLESKDELRKRGLPSPDDADAVALTFTVEHVIPRGRLDPTEQRLREQTRKVRVDYDPYGNDEVVHANQKVVEWSPR